MNEDRLEPLIDAAAGEMMNVEPPRSLAPAVMSRLRGANQPRRMRWRFVGSGLSPTAAAAAAVICVALLLVTLNRTPERGPQMVKTKETTPGLAEPAAAPAAQRVAERTNAPVDPTRNVAPKVRPPASNAAPPATATSTSETSIAIEPIAPARLEVPQLEVGGVVVDQIRIDPLVIESLGASND